MAGAVITNNGRKIMVNRFTKASPDYTVLSKFKVGINQTAVVASDTDLDRKVPITGTEAVDACDATTGWSAGTDSAVALNTTSYKEGTGSLSLAKSGTSGTVFSMSKTTTSRDFTSKDLHTWVYITALADLVSSGTAIVIRFGSDNSNFYYKNVDISALSAGWNLIVFSSAGATGTTGTPVIGACDYYYIALNTDLAADTVAANRVLVDDLKVASADDYVYAYEGGYPSLDETNMEIVYRAFLASTNGNGYDIDGFALENTDATPLMGFEAEFTNLSKSNQDEFTFIVKKRLL